MSVEYRRNKKMIVQLYLFHGEKFLRKQACCMVRGLPLNYECKAKELTENSTVFLRTQKVINFDDKFQSRDNYSYSL